MRVGGNLNLGAVKTSGGASLQLANVSNVLLLDDAPRISKVDLGGAHIGDQVKISELTCELIEADGLSVGKQVFINDSAIDKINLRGLRLADNLEIRGSQFNQDFILEDALIDGNFLIAESGLDGAMIGEFANMFIQKSRIKSQLVIRHIRLSQDWGGAITVRATDVDGALDLEDLQLNKPIILQDLRIKGQLGIRRIHASDTSAQITVQAVDVDGALNLEDLQLDEPIAIDGKLGALYMNGCQLGSFDIGGTKIHGELLIRNSGFGKDVAMNGIVVDDDLIISGVEFKDPVNLSFAKVKANLDFDAVRFGGPLDISGARVEGLLAFASQKVRCTWGSGATLNLTDAFAHSLEDRTDAWP